MHQAIVPMIGRRALLAAAALAAIVWNPLRLLAFHDEEGQPPKVTHAEMYRPTPMPDRIVLTWTGDPARTQAVTWRTDESIERGLAQIAVAEAGPKFAGKAETVEAKTTEFDSDLGHAHCHTAQFTGLAPDTKYAYRVGDGVNWSEWFHFVTASNKPQAFSFIYFGDAQNDIRSLWSRVIREAVQEAPRARFMIHAGDLVNRGDADGEWGEWFGAGAWLNAMIPSVPTPGNHEYVRKVGPDGAPLNERMLTQHWRPQFALPENGPTGLEETVYYLDYQGLRIISLNSNSDREVQATWLDGVLSDNPCYWTVVTFHHPIFSTAKGRDNPELRASWKPIFDKHRVDLVLQGHDHTYARTGMQITENVPTGASAHSPESGTVYVVSVSGPKMYQLERREFMHRAAEDTQLFQVISIDGARLRYEARTATGELYDAFTLLKRPRQVNELVDEIPNAPERLRPQPVQEKATAAGE